MSLSTTFAYSERFYNASSQIDSWKSWWFLRLLTHQGMDDTKSKFHISLTETVARQISSRENVVTWISVWTCISSHILWHTLLNHKKLLVDTSEMFAHCTVTFSNVRCGTIWIFKNMVRAMRYDAIRCGAVRCDAMRCNAVRRGAVRWSISANLNSTHKTIHKSCGQEMATKTRRHDVTYSLKRDHTKFLQVRRCEFNTKTQGNMRPGCVTIERIKLANRDSNEHSNRSENQANMRTISREATIKAVITEPDAAHAWAPKLYALPSLFSRPRLSAYALCRNAETTAGHKLWPQSGHNIRVSLETYQKSVCTVWPHFVAMFFFGERSSSHTTVTTSCHKLWPHSATRCGHILATRLQVANWAGILQDNCERRRAEKWRRCQRKASAIKHLSIILPFKFYTMIRTFRGRCLATNCVLRSEAELKRCSI